jgi:hypothetical protein
MVYAMMSLFVPPFLSMTVIQRKGTSVVSEIANDYKGSKLSQMLGQLGQINGGMRLPDTGLTVYATGMLQENTFFEGALYKLLDPSVFTLLIVNADGASTDDFPVQTDILTSYKIRPSQDGYQKEFTRLFSAKPGFLLVRPDSYVAISGHLERIGEIRNWLISQVGLQD